MKIQKFDTTTQLTAMPKLFPINCFLYEEAKELTLIDALTKRQSRQLLSYLQQQAKPLTRIVFTHAHSDHIGDLAALKAAFPQAEVYLSKQEATGLYSLKKNNLVAPNAAIDHLVRENDRIGSLQVLAAPGHTKGSIALYAENSQFLFVGDLLQSHGGIGIAGEKIWRFPFIAWATWDPTTAFASARKLCRLPVKKLFCGHGEPLASWQELPRLTEGS